MIHAGMGPRRRLALIAAAAVLLPILTAVPVMAETPAAVRYVTLLQDARDALLRHAPPGLADLSEARADVDDAAALSVGPDPVVAPILEDLAAGTDAAIADARARLDAAVAALALPRGAAPAAGDDAAGAVLHQVYARPEFRSLDSRPSQSVFERIGAAVRDLFTWVAGGLGTGGSLLVALLVAALLLAVAWRLVRGVTAGRALRTTEVTGPGAPDPDAEWRAALAAAQGGDHREAIRHAFRSALLAVAVRGRLAVDAAWTTRELLARATADAGLLAVLAPAAAAFDHAWYSGAPVSAQDWDTARMRCEAVRRLAGAPLLASA